MADPAPEEEVPIPVKPISGGASNGMPSWADYLKQLEEEEAANPKPVETAAPKRTVAKRTAKTTAVAAPALTDEQLEKKKKREEEAERRREEMKAKMAAGRATKPKQEDSVVSEEAAAPSQPEANGTPATAPTEPETSPISVPTVETPVLAIDTPSAPVSEVQTPAVTATPPPTPITEPVLPVETGNVTSNSDSLLLASSTPSVAVSEPLLDAEPLVAPVPVVSAHIDATEPLLTAPSNDLVSPSTLEAASLLAASPIVETPTAVSTSVVQHSIVDEAADSLLLATEQTKNASTPVLETPSPASAPVPSTSNDLPPPSTHTPPPTAQPTSVLDSPIDTISQRLQQPPTHAAPAPAAQEAVVQPIAVQETPIQAAPVAQQAPISSVAPVAAPVVAAAIVPMSFVSSAPVQNLAREVESYQVQQSALGTSQISQPGTSYSTPSTPLSGGSRTNMSVTTPQAAPLTNATNFLSSSSHEDLLGSSSASSSYTSSSYAAPASYSSMSFGSSGYHGHHAGETHHMQQNMFGTPSRYSSSSDDMERLRSEMLNQFRGVLGNYEQAMMQVVERQTRKKSEQLIEQNEVLKRQNAELEMQLRSLRAQHDQTVAQGSANAKELSVLRARVSLTDSKVATLTEQLQLKAQENAKLAQLCDELIGSLEAAQTQ